MTIKVKSWLQGIFKQMFNFKHMQCHHWISRISADFKFLFWARTSSTHWQVLSQMRAQIKKPCSSFLLQFLAANQVWGGKKKQKKEKKTQKKQQGEKYLLLPDPNVPFISCPCPKSLVRHQGQKQDTNCCLPLHENLTRAKRIRPNTSSNVQILLCLTQNGKDEKNAKSGAGYWTEMV